MRVLDGRYRITAAPGLTAVLLLLVARWSAASHPYAPEQPIEFSPVVHVGDDKLNCEFCHTGVRRSPFAGVAPVERCMGCHRFVNPDNPEIARVRRYWDARSPIPWVRV